MRLLKLSRYKYGGNSIEEVYINPDHIIMIEESQINTGTRHSPKIKSVKCTAIILLDVGLIKVKELDVVARIELIKK